MVNRANILGFDIEYETVCRDVKYPRLEFKTGGLVLILPRGYKKETELIDKHKDWVYKKNSIIKTAIEQAKNQKIERNRSEEDLKKLVNRFAKKFSMELKVSIKKIYFKKLKSKWGSCSSKGNLTFNSLLRHLSEDLIKYVVLHEVAHRIEKKHKDGFWDIISRYFSNYAEKEKKLLLYWFVVQEFIKKKSS